jgi:hypothetical protein
MEVAILSGMDAKEVNGCKWPPKGSFYRPKGSSLENYGIL